MMDEEYPLHRKSRQKEDHIQMIPVDVHEREIKRAAEMADMNAELRHVRENLTTIEDGNRQLLEAMRSMQGDMSDVKQLSKRMTILESQMKPLIEDFQSRQGRKEWFNNLGVQAPFWVIIIVAGGMALLWWLSTNGQGGMPGG